MEFGWRVKQSGRGIFRYWRTGIEAGEPSEEMLAERRDGPGQAENRKEQQR